MTAEFPAVYEHLRPAVLPYVHVLLDVQQYPAWLIWLAQVFASLLLTVVAVNVAVLVYARTASRRGEITVRTALGAGRSRIVGQLFLEALVLSLLAAALGLLIAQVGYHELARLASFETLLPYWIGDRLSPATIPYAVGLSVLAAIIVGILPALQATGRHLQSSLRHLGGGTDMRMGKTWTALIIVQVAIAVAVLPSVVAIASKNIWRTWPEPTFPAEELLTLRLQREADGVDPPELEASFATRQEELIRRLGAESGVAGVTFAVPSAEGPAFIETDRRIATDERIYSRVRAVDPSYFDVLGVPLLTGRHFAPGDLAAGATTVIVNRAFVQRFLGGGDVLGRRVRKVTGVGRNASVATSHEIIGVVEDMYAIHNRPDRTEPVLYHAAAHGSESLSIAVRTRGTTPARLAARVRDIAGEVAPDWQLTVRPMASLGGRSEAKAIRFVALMVGLITVSVLLLSAAGVSALMSFAVTRRRREIGIRTALGASHLRLVASIFSHAIRQLAVGLIVGAAAAGALDRLSGGALLGGHAAILLPLVATLMVLAGLLATMGPARRALRVHPMETLREE